MSRYNLVRTDTAASDGGGIRGYGSLFILDELMKECHTWERIFDSGIGRDPNHRDAETPLPCEYFDYFAGTSTGGSVKQIGQCAQRKLTFARLIAIMVGRLRMSVDAAKDKYAELGRNVFGRSRWWRTSKYDHKPLEEAVKEVVRLHHPPTYNRKPDSRLVESMPVGPQSCRT